MYALKERSKLYSLLRRTPAYVEVHHLFPDKHTRLSHKVKYTRKKINEGTLEEWKRVITQS